MWCINPHWKQPMCKNNHLKIYHILGSGWLDVSGGWRDCLGLHLTWFCSKKESKALLGCEDMCVCLCIGGSGALDILRDSNSSEMKAAFQESSEAVQGLLTAAFLAKVEFQQLTFSHIRYLRPDTWGNLLYMGFFATISLCCCKPAKAQIHIYNLGPEQSTGRLSSAPWLEWSTCLRQHREENCLVRNQHQQKVGG